MKSCNAVASRGLLAPVLVSCALGLTACGGEMNDWVKRNTQSPTAATRTAPPDVEASRVSGRVVTDQRANVGPTVQERSSGSVVGTAVARGIVSGEGGEVTLNYVDTDVREIVRVILGDMLKLNYTIDPSFRGLVTIRTARPLRREELLPTLQALLAQVGGAMTYENGIIRIGAADSEGVAPLVDGLNAGTGAQVVQLRYASARQLAAMLGPYVGEGAKLVVDPTRNVLVVSGAPAARRNIVDLIRIFDVDYLAAQSYALFPVKTGEPAKLAADLQAALQIDADGALAGALKVIPIDAANAIMVVAQQPAYLDRAARFIAQLDQVKESFGRGMHVLYLRNAQATDLQPILQKAVNPPTGAGGAGDTPPGGVAPGSEAGQVTATAPRSNGLGGASAITSATPGNAGLGASTTGQSGAYRAGQQAAVPESAQQITGGAAKGPQIIADAKSNALIVMATESEYAMIEAAVRRLDVLPLQVLIEATVAEVTLNDNLQYGTQYFLSNNGNSVTLSNAQSGSPTIIDPANPLTNAQLFAGLLAPAFPGFAIARTVGPTQFAIEALKTVTDVRVISAPKLLILDKQRARLQVGDLVPITTQSAQATTAPNAPIVNTVQYQETGVILTVTPRINSGGLVTLDIEQEVSSVNPNPTFVGINSPTFSQRKIDSKIVVQDGETISLAGLISDRKQNDNSGIPLLQDIPILGALFSTKGVLAARTELLVLITPRVVYDQRGARELTDELRRKLTPSALIP